MDVETIEQPTPAAQDDMILDMDTFDFSALDDVVVDSNELGYDTKQTGADLIDKDKEDMEGLDFDEEDSEEEESDDLPEEDEEVEEESEEEDSEEESEESEEPSDEEVDFESYELTLPTGETVVLSELVTGYKAKKELETERAEFETVKTEFDKKLSGIKGRLELTILEADKVIADYDGFDWAAYRDEDSVGYVENREFLDRYKQRREEIMEEYEKVKKEEAEQASQEFQTRAKEAGTILARDIPGWSNELYQQLMMYAIENGAQAEDIQQTTDPMVFKTLFKAMQFDKGKHVVKAKVKRLGSPKKVVKSSQKPVRTETKVNPGKRAFLKKIETGDVSERDLSDAFSYLED